MLSSWQDAMNAGFEFGAGLAVLHHCWRLHQDKEVRGLSIPAVVFFTLWGGWNIYYYPHLDQTYSFAGGIFVTLANVAYVVMLITYSQHPAAQWIKRQTVCRVQGHRNDSPFFVSGNKCLYPCKHCGEDIFGRTWDDLVPLADDEREMLEETDQVYFGGSRP